MVSEQDSISGVREDGEWVKISLDPHLGIPKGSLSTGKSACIYILWHQKTSEDIRRLLEERDNKARARETLKFV